MRPPEVPESWIKRVLPPLWSFLPASMPAMARRNYRYELTAAFFLPFILAVVDSAIIGVVVKNAYAGVVDETLLNFVVAVITASAAFSNIVSFAWVRLSHGRDKVPFINGLQVGMIVLVGLIGAMPRSVTGLWMLAGCVLAARFCWAGFITIRSTIWRQNYSRPVRARVTGKLATVQVLTLALLGLGLGASMDADPEWFRVLLPAGCVLSLAGVWAWSRIRLRGRASLIGQERASRGDGDAPSFNPAGMVRLLAGDRMFAGYMACMFLLGLGNLMQTPLLVVLLRDEFHMEYLGGIKLTSSIPLAMMPISIPLWARLLDRVHVIQFRRFHSWFFVVAAAVSTLAVHRQTAWLLTISAVVQGLAYGGGALAWNLGHLDFAPAHRASAYMGVHVTLTGVRGLIAPFLSVGLYELLLNRAPHASTWAFGACFVFCAIGAVGFQVLARRKLQADALLRPAETAPPTRVGQGGGPGDRGTEGQRDRGTEGQRDRGTEGQRDRGTEGQRDRGTEGQRDRGTEGQREREGERRGVLLGGSCGLRPVSLRASVPPAFCRSGVLAIRPLCQTHQLISILRGWALACLGSVRVNSPFLSSALALPSSTTLGSATRRLSEPTRRSLR
ncbi:MAG: MFS transporter [Phycisphaerales bacterium]|nr:MFS transporter [Phycisphaerales bacterium]